MTGAQPLSRVRALFVLEKLPLPIRGGADLRSVELVHSMAAVGLGAMFALSPAPAPPGTEPGWFVAPGEAPAQAQLGRAMLRSLTKSQGHPSDYLWTPTARYALLDLVRSWRPDVAVLRFGALPALEVLKESVPKVIYDAHNVEAPLYRRIVAVATEHGGSARALLELTAKRTDAAEATMASGVDQIWVCSESDAAEMRSEYPGCAPVVIVPNTVAVPPGLPPRAAEAQGDLRLVFPASFGYHPNVQAAGWLSSCVLPALREVVPSARLVLVGSAPPASLRLLAQGGEGVEVTGAVPDLNPYWDQATAVPVPLREGGGTRLKVLEAFAAGVPVISTAKGVEGLEVSDGEHFLLAEDAPQMTAAALRLWREPELRLQLCSAAYQLVSERYGPAAAAAAIQGALAALGRGAGGADLGL